MDARAQDDTSISPALQFVATELTGDGRLLSLTALDVLISELQQAAMLRNFWVRLLEPTAICKFLEDIMNRAQLDCAIVLSHFRFQIEQIATDYLESSSTVPESFNRNTLIDILQCCSKELDGDLDIEDYYSEIAEIGLESPYDPDFNAEQYYEHQDRIEVDEDYAQMARENAELKEARAAKSRHWRETNWRLLFEKAEAFARNGPSADFRVEFHHESSLRD